MAKETPVATSKRHRDQIFITTADDLKGTNLYCTTGNELEVQPSWGGVTQEVTREVIREWINKKPELGKEINRGKVELTFTCTICAKPHIKELDGDDYRLIASNRERRLHSPLHAATTERPDPDREVQEVRSREGDAEQHPGEAVEQLEANNKPDAG